MFVPSAKRYVARAAQSFTANNYAKRKAFESHIWKDKGRVICTTPQMEVVNSRLFREPGGNGYVYCQKMSGDIWHVCETNSKTNHRLFQKAAADSDLTVCYDKNANRVLWTRKQGCDPNPHLPPSDLEKCPEERTPILLTDFMEE